jgi:hypothetical protein
MFGGALVPPILPPESESGRLSNILRIQFTMSTLSPHNVSGTVWSGVGGVDGAVLTMACNDSDYSSRGSSGSGGSGNCSTQVIIGGNFSFVNTSFVGGARPAPYHLARVDLGALQRSDWKHAVSPFTTSVQAAAPSASSGGGNVSTIAVAGDGRVFAGGEFSFVGDDGAVLHNLLLGTRDPRRVVGVTSSSSKPLGVRWRCLAGNICPRVGVRISCGNNSGGEVSLALLAAATAVAHLEYGCVLKLP